MKEETTKKNKAIPQKKIPKDISQVLLKKIWANILKAIAVIIYFVILNLAYVNIKHERLIGDIEVFAGAFLISRISNVRKSI